MSDIRSDMFPASEYKKSGEKRPTVDRVKFFLEMRKLPKEQYVVMDLHYWSDESVESIALQMGVDVVQAKALLNSAKRAMKRVRDRFAI
jgi:DNA-directed RNA polymerase specialized sigma24 family protein